jgi:hypothetical protein
MSFAPTPDPTPGDKLACDAIDMVIVPRTHDIGGFTVRRALPFGKAAHGRPVHLLRSHGSRRSSRTASGIDVRPHPHIGLVDGDLSLRGRDPAPRLDSASYLPVRPGEVNLDDRRARHRPFRAHQTRVPAIARAAVRSARASRAGSRCRKTHEEIDPAASNIVEQQRRCPSSTG